MNYYVILNARYETMRGGPFKSPTDALKYLGALQRGEELYVRVEAPTKQSAPHQRTYTFHTQTPSGLAVDVTYVGETAESISMTSVKVESIEMVDTLAPDFRQFLQLKCLAHYSKRPVT